MEKSFGQHGIGYLTVGSGPNVRSDKRSGGNFRYQTYREMLTRSFYETFNGPLYYYEHTSICTYTIRTFVQTQFCILL